MKRLIYISILIFFGCSGLKKDKGDNSFIEIKYAKGFTIEKFDDYIKVELRNPWDTLRTLQTYILVNNDSSMPGDIPSGTLIRVPIKSVVATASTQCATLDELGVIDRVKGVCEPRYIDIDYIKKGIIKGEISDLGEASAPDVEKLIELEPEGIMTSPFQNVGYGRMGKTGIPIIECADYMESSPLGRAEWIKLHGLLFGKERQADSIFNETEKLYNEIKEKTSHIANRPTLITEHKTGPSWYIAGGKSYIASLYKDAGAHYLWEDTEKAGSMPLSYEEVFEKGSEADFWLIKYNATMPLTYSALKDEIPLNAKFKAWKEKNIYTCNTGEVTYYEEMPLHPDRLLKDLAFIFHPELFPGYKPRYFFKMED
ncbi:MAG: ABC transporter substrate-binding protein [Bacteroidales bacterium]|nr:ABC transporter substrate-binding protein [Bacteroidales bacterium]